MSELPICVYCEQVVDPTKPYWTSSDGRVAASSLEELPGTTGASTLSPPFRDRARCRRRAARCHSPTIGWSNQSISMTDDSERRQAGVSRHRVAWFRVCSTRDRRSDMKLQPLPELSVHRSCAHAV
jgi:hypothetical protein